MDSACGAQGAHNPEPPPVPAPDPSYFPQPKKYDLSRTLRFGTVGLVWVGPWMNIRFSLLDYFVPGNNHRIAFVKMLISLYAMGPLTTTVGCGLNEFLKKGATMKVCIGGGGD